LGLCLIVPATRNTSFTARQGAAFTIASTTLNNEALILDATGPVPVGVSTNFIRVLYNGGRVTVATTTNVGVSYTTAGTLTGTTFANGDTITVVAPWSITRPRSAQTAPHSVQQAIPHSN